ncbi:MAG TPA: hotdog domain-containing protein, partial [Acidimicrobiales bacterium]|nr:hotdog domain-containing protein [Acidimicrobiales bacterium]
PVGDEVRAEAQVLRAGRQLVVVECRVLDTQDRVIAAADFSGMVVPLREPLIHGTSADPRDPEL